MKKFSEFRVGDTFHSTCSISEKELEEYLNFSRVRNAFLEDKQSGEQIVSGRAILSRMEGEFTRLSQIYGNHIIFLGTDGDPEWKNRNTRFLKPLYTDQVLKLKFTISQVEDMDDEFGKIAVDYEGTDNEGETIVLSKRNIYRIKKEPPR
ncbi:hypothetical protein AAA799E16_00677 [Marine Group I thaumarchaeote SCGC AAA799-E16]|uniref:Uncharacterized protein n=5 Tax=Marine Group I TaxID=905826 RepID=A0A087S5Y5_9ARCH|nr:hypothetical protein AAA799E16_00677 [Marine Group I thaumarchaeote SCGC AAA799-E16]KFM16069.1 hypothetical protein AAA799D11_00868 [Marine Group I thaumarchaeote SCGC AAA799-D11]KFM17806.1 hypothetical protein SCCGRSA3_01746 [Marine Group I thaumarchaeote SCGC RSA3]KFM21139.1 hypothetical protein AAA799B03_01340 [Marine Group I thaumarchaeote SCGC AAA799-B03]